MQHVQNPTPKASVQHARWKKYNYKIKQEIRATQKKRDQHVPALKSTFLNYHQCHAEVRLSYKH